MQEVFLKQMHVSHLAKFNETFYAAYLNIFYFSNTLLNLQAELFVRRNGFYS